ncbi:uncharacterized protein LOC117296905 [Asterias rubens]|uniref:uncharacterized protein LOC117296905 n=1 Tax=Asterias rubens TaxID=7604 RepID=UPI0014550816|nr:uncharacterized protein LOC117296905 [Asterias rubens]
MIISDRVFNITMTAAMRGNMSSLWMFFFVVGITLQRSLAIYTFREQPSDTSALQGSTVVLHCSVEQYINTTAIVWWSRDSVISHNKDLKLSSLNTDQLQRYSISGDASRGEFNLRIVNFTATDAASYRCQMFAASTHEGFFKFSHTAELTVAPFDPQCYVKSSVSIPMVGDTVDLVCESRNPNYMGELRWMYSAKSLPSFLTGNTSRNPVLRNVVTRVLTYKDYDARFMCFEQSRTCFLIPLRRFIPVLLQAADENPMIGDNLTYRCVANKDLRPLAYNWFINGHDTGVYTEEFTFGPVNASHNASILECAVKHSTGFKGNDSVTINLQQTLNGGSSTMSPDTGGFSRPRTSTFGGGLSPGLESTSLLNALFENQGNAKTQEDTWDGLIMPLVISASVVGLLLITVIVLLTVFLSRQRASNRRVTDSKTTDTRGPPSDCVPLDYVANTITDSPSISIGTLKGYKNPAGCGSVDTFELDTDPECQPEYFTLEHPYSNPYYEGIPGQAKLEQKSIDTENQCSEFDGIEVSETITPDCDLTARNRRFSFGSSRPPPVPAGPIALPQVSMIIPPEFGGNDAEVESLVAAYAITDVARPSGTSDAKHRGGSLKRPLPARPSEYRAPSVTFVEEQPFRRFGSLKSLGQPAVGAMARSNSLKRPLPAKPKDDAVTPGHRTPDPYRAPNSLFANIPPFLSSEASAVAVLGAESDRPSAVTKTHKFQLRDVPQKYQRPANVNLERLSAATSASEGDYAEIDSDQDVTETDNLLSNYQTNENKAKTPSTGIDDSDSESKDTGSLEIEVVFEDDYAMVDESEDQSDSINDLRNQSSPTLQPKLTCELPTDSDCEDTVVSPLKDTHQENPKLNKDGTLQYARVQKPKCVSGSVGDAKESSDGVNKRPCALDLSPTSACFPTETPDSCQERAFVQTAEPHYALVK